MTEERTPNFPELKRLNLWVQAQSRLEPGERKWVQKWWVTLREEKPMCKSAYCVAGAAIVRAGSELKMIHDDGLESMLLDGRLIGNDGIIATANEILGIDRVTGGDLYMEYNTNQDIDRIIRQIFKDHDRSYARTKAAPDKQLVIKEES